jgi:hypothetical protein
MGEDGEIKVVAKPITPVDREEIKTGYMKEIEELRGELQGNLSRDHQEYPVQCRIDIMGTHHCGGQCNLVKVIDHGYFSELEPYCRVERLHNLEAAIQEVSWLPNMIDYYWQNGINLKGREFLDRTQFLYRYRYVPLPVSL